MVGVLGSGSLSFFFKERARAPFFSSLASLLSLLFSRFSSLASLASLALSPLSLALLALLLPGLRPAALAFVLVVVVLLSLSSGELSPSAGLGESLARLPKTPRAFFEVSAPAHDPSAGRSSSSTSSSGPATAGRVPPGGDTMASTSSLRGHRCVVIAAWSSTSSRFDVFVFSSFFTLSTKLERVAAKRRGEVSRRRESRPHPLTPSKASWRGGTRKCIKERQSQRR